MAKKPTLRKMGSWCSICAARGINGATHKCKPAVFAAIDAAHTRAINLETKAGDNLGHPGNYLSLHQRLARGYRMLRDTGI